MKKAGIGIAVLIVTITVFLVCYAAEQECSPWGGISFICGPVAVEDLVRVPNTQWIIGSGMAESRNPGKLHLIDGLSKSWEVLRPGPNPRPLPAASA